MVHNAYENPLISRYASRAMSGIWSAQKKHSTWRKMWVALAEAEAELGLPISAEQLREMKAHIDDIDFAVVAKYERQTRHDVMAHLHAFGDKCPQARPIIHWGATSAFVTDNTDLLILREALELIATRLATVIDALARFAEQHKALATLGFTHLQPAQPTTVGRRACLWAYDLVMDLEEVEHRLSGLRARSVKGTTGTQASFLRLFDGDDSKVVALEKAVAEKLGFSDTYAVTGQTYSRKVDTQVLESLAGVGASAHRAATDLRILAHRKELEEPFEKDQVGSSAMAYKRNPMRCERICALARYAMSLPTNALATHATQWMERTLDDSANRRIVLPEAFLAVDALLLIYQNVAAGLVVYPNVIARHLAEEMPLMASEIILMDAVAAGGDRQELHERIRQHSVAAAAVVKEQGRDNDLLDRLAADEAFAGVDLHAAVDPQRLIGRSEAQVISFLEDVVEPIRRRYRDRQIEQDAMRV